jgi:hypothetical protein
VNGGQLKIYDCTFESNTATFVSTSEALFRELPEISSLEFPAGNMLPATPLLACLAIQYAICDVLCATREG